MKKFLFITLLLQSICITNAFSQTGKINGKIIDKKTGETLPGASVLIEGTTQGASSDFDGNYIITSIKPGIYNVICKYVSYANKLIKDVEVKAGESITVNFSMEEPQGDTLGEVTITANLNKENVNTLFIMQKNSASVSDGISAETIKKTPDRNTSDVLKRVSGASIQDNKFAIIRGMNDRYNSAYINDAPLPSSESDKRAFSFDIFPSNMLDNLVIFKTATPDLPGDFAGGVIMINTKDIPEKNNYNISISGAQNTLTTYKKFKTYEGGKTDWLGIDDGSRQLKSTIPTTEAYNKIQALGSASNDSMVKYAKQMIYPWAIKNKTAAPNFNLQYSMGHVGKLFGKRFGSVFALNYNNINNSQFAKRREFEEQGAEIMKIKDYQDSIFTNTIMASSLWNFTYKFSDRHQLSLKNIYSINTDDKVILRQGIQDATIPQVEKSDLRWFTQNRIYSGQFAGKHVFLSDKLKLKWVGSYSDIVRDIPNMRRMVYNKQSSNINDEMPMLAAIQSNNVVTTGAGTMFFSNNKEKILSGRYDLSYNLELKKSKHEIKVGGFHQYREREFSARLFGFTKYKANQPSKFDNTLLSLPEDEIFTEAHMGKQNKAGTKINGFKLTEATTVTDKYQASSMLNAAYVMSDSRFFKDKLRFIYGVRAESYHQNLQTEIITNSTTPTPVVIDTTVLDILPSINTVFAINDKMNIRAAYYRTVCRPEFRELAPFNFYDFILDFSTSGNPDLKRATINNYDLRYEWYPGAGQIFSTSVFYKDINNAIEQISNTASQIRSTFFVNVPQVTNIGTELEYRVKLGTMLKKDSVKFLANSTLFANIAFIKSKVDVSGINGAEERPLQGQSPYIINAGYQYIDENKGWAAAVSYNVVGKRIFIVGSVDEPTYWEKPRNILDFQLAKTYKKKYEIKFNARDIIAQNIVFYQDLNKNGKLDKASEKANQDATHINTLDNVMINTRVGSTYSLTFSMKF